ncbi:MAG: hypothetical protein IJQ58_07555 [Synergistaceae bacterium]|nr:hypothetical protein [Synergistaceae bacterium]
MEGYEWYKKGTIAVRHSEREVVGTDTEWLKDGIKRGDIFILDNIICEIEEVVGNMSLTLTKPFTGESGGGRQYAIITRAGEVLQAEIARDLAQTVAYWNEREASYTEKFAQYEQRIKALEALGLYVDTDGDIAQGETGTPSTNPTPLLTLPIASRTQAGIVKIGGNIDVDEEGTISADVDAQTVQESLEKSRYNS